MWLRKKKKKKTHKSLSGFLSANKTNNYNRRGKEGGGVKRENPKESIEQVKK